MLSIYLAPQQGDGSKANPFRSIINTFIDPAAGETFEEMDNPARRVSLCIVSASSATHAAIAADPRVLAIGDPAAESGALRTNLDSLLTSLIGLAALKTALEAHGVSTTWYSASNTLRDGIRWLLRNFATAQIADGQGNSDVKTVIAGALEATVGSYPVGVRNGVRNWMAARGLASAWITNTTTIRQVLHFIVENLGFGVIGIGGERF